MTTQMAKNGFRTSTVRRAPAQNWQTQQEYDARDLWDESQEWTSQDRGNADTQRTRQRGTTDMAYDALSGYQPTQQSGYSPTELSAFSPNEYLNYDIPSGPGGGGGSGRAGAFSSAALQDFDPNFQSPELQEFNADDVSGFDPSAYGKEYAGGAYDEFQMNLGDELDALGNNAVGRGRLNTGFFDKDRGGVVTRLGGDFNSKIAQAATVFSGQRAGMLQSGAGMRLARAQGIDANSLQGRQMALSRAQGIDSNQLRAAEGADQFALEGGRLAHSGNELRSTNARSAAQLAFERASRLDDIKYGQAHDVDEANFRTRNTALDASMGRESTYLDDYQRSADRYSDYVGGTRDWAASDREAQDMRDGARPVNFGRRLIGGPRYEDQGSTAIARRQARALGVPYKG